MDRTSKRLLPALVLIAACHHAVGTGAGAKRAPRARIPAAARCELSSGGADGDEEAYKPLCHSVSAESFAHLSSQHCRSAFSALMSNDTSDVVRHMIDECMTDEDLGLYADTIYANERMSPDAYRAYVATRLELPAFKSCRWCLILAERDLGLSYLEAVPQDDARAQQHFTKACTAALRAPPLVFVDGRHPCSLLHAARDLRTLVRGMSEFLSSVASGCGLRSLVNDTHVVEVAWGLND